MDPKSPPHPPISSTVPDWSRETPRKFWDPSRKLIRSIRKYQRAREKRGILHRLISKRWVFEHRFWSVVTQAEISLDSDIGGGVLLPHPNGVVIHPGAVIGPNSLIFQQVTIGVRAGAEHPPIIGGHVDIGAGAKILGAVHIGDHAAIGANAVVLKDVPAAAVAVGIPARILGEK